MTYLKPFAAAAVLLGAATLQGQTITWTAAANPHIVSGDFTVAPGQTLVIQPGVHVQVNGSSNLNIQGLVMGRGTAAQPITFTSSSNFSSLINVRRGGTLDLDQADIDCQITTEHWPTTMLFNHCNFHGNGYMTCGTTLVLENSTFSVMPNIWEVAARIHNVTSTVPFQAPVVTGYIDGVTVRNAGDLGFTVGSNLQPMYINHITASGHAVAGVRLWGGNVAIGPDSAISGNAYAVYGQGGSGLWPGSSIPTTGNTNAVIPMNIGDWRSRTFWPPLALPYAFTGRVSLFGGGLTILPGAVVKMGPGAYILNTYGTISAHGTAAQPIRFERLNPAQAWDEILYNRTSMSISHAIIDGATAGVAAGEFAGPSVRQCTFINNAVGVTGACKVRGSTFMNNQYGVYTATGPADLNGQFDANVFLNNTINIRNEFGCTVDARNNWWGTPAGPGAGSVTGCTTTSPVRTQAPAADEPPELRAELPYNGRPGTRIMIVWTASDDHRFVSQRIDMDPTGVGDTFPVPIAAGLPGSARAFEWVIPSDINEGRGGIPYIRVTATDTIGQQEYSQASIGVDSVDAAGTVTFTSPLPHSVYQPQQPLDIRWTNTPFPYPYNDGDCYLFLDNDDRNIDLVTHAIISQHQGFDDPHLPAISTDGARIGYHVTIANASHWYYSAPFAIRPDARIGDAPPVVSVTAPAEGAALPAGTALSIAWTASDDEGLRSFDVMASYDAGDNWQYVITDLPGTARAYSWPTAPGQGMPIRLRVVARDLRFQNSSGERNIVLTPGSSVTPCGTADFNNDGDVGTDADIEAFFACLAGSCCGTCYEHGADFNNDGDVGTDGDIEAFFRVLAGGSC